MGHHTTYAAAERIVHRKTVLGPDEIVEIKAWKVPKSDAFPRGVKFSFAYVRRERGAFRRVLGVDNERGKGPHVHRRGEERPLEMEDWREMLRWFYEEVEALRRRDHDG